MSRSLPEHLRIGLAPGRLALAAYAAGWRRRWHDGLREGETIEVAPAAGPRWQAAVDAIPEALAARLSSTPGVVEHGLFPAALVSDVIVGRGEQVEHRSYR